MEENVCFRVCLTGISFHIVCRYESTRRYCANYLTEAPVSAAHPIIITDADIEEERSRLLQKKNPGEALEASSPQALETLVLCRRLAEHLPGWDRVLFHGSCLSYDGQGVLFTAKSGTGKSTHTGLWREAFGSRVVMVNDDKPFLHISTEGVTAFGTPWRGKHGLGSNTSAPLKAICIVYRDTENRIERISPREALPWLLQQTYSPEDPAMLLRTLALVDRLSQTVRLYRLYCNMDRRAAQVARNGIFMEG